MLSLREHGVFPVMHINEAIGFLEGERRAARLRKCGDMVSHLVLGMFVGCLIPVSGEIEWWSAWGTMASLFITVKATNGPCDCDSSDNE